MNYKQILISFGLVLFLGFFVYKFYTKIINPTAANWIPVTQKFMEDNRVPSQFFHCIYYLHSNEANCSPTSPFVAQQEFTCNLDNNQCYWTHF